MFDHVANLVIALVGKPILSIPNRKPLRIGNFVVISKDDWEREQETLYILQDQTLMRQIAESMETHTKGREYRPNFE